MDRNVLGFPASASGVQTPADRQRVLRNTYGLLALSLVPTVLGAWIGVSSGLFATMLRSPGLTAIVFLVGAFGLMAAISAKRDSAAGVYLLLGFTFFMGLMLSRLIGFALSVQGGGQMVMIAFGGTAAIFAGMAFLATVIKRDLTMLTQFLFVGALLVCVGSLINVFVGSSTMFLVIAFAAMAIFSVFILVDVRRILDGGETNYVMATLNIYMDLYNVFQTLLSLLLALGGGGGNSRD